MLTGGFVQSATGFGFALVAAPVLAAALGPRTAVPADALLGVLVNLLTLGVERRPRAVLHRRAGVLVAASVPGMALGALVLVRAPADVLRLLVALVVVGSVAAYVRTPAHAQGRPPPRTEAVAVGALSGAMAATAGINGPPLLLHLRRAGARADQVRDTLAAVFLAGGVLTLAALAVAGALRLPDSMLLLCLAAAAGQALGGTAFRRLAARREAAIRAVLALSAALALVPAAQALLG